MQRLSQIVARRRKKLRLSAIGRLGSGTRVVGCCGLRLQLADQVQLFVADSERLRQEIVQVVTESEDKDEDDHQHPGDGDVHLIAVHSDTNDERNESGQHETVKGGLIYRR